MSAERPRDPWSSAVWCSIPGIVAGMALSSYLESAAQTFFLWNPGTILVGILGGIAGARVGYAVAARRVPGIAFWIGLAIVLLLVALFAPTA